MSEGLDTSKLYQVLTVLKRKGFDEVPIDRLDQYMRNIGNAQFSYDIFKSAYDQDLKIQDIVTDFDKNKISFKTSEIDDIKTKKRSKKDTVGTMAKRATKVGDI